MSEPVVLSAPTLPDPPEGWGPVGYPLPLLRAALGEELDVELPDWDGFSGDDLDE